MAESTRKYQRKHLRAPISSMILYEDDGYVFKAQLANISKGGVLVANLPNFPTINIIGTVIDIPEMPVIKSDDLTRLREVKTKEYSRYIFRTRVRTVRRIGNTTSVGELFKKNIGCAFVDSDTDLIAAIEKYVASFAYNIVFFLRLLTTADFDEDNLEKIKILSGILGYDSQMKISLLAKQVTHDYKSLQWL